MRTKSRVYGMGLLILVVSMVMMTGCCARLQSPIVFDSFCGGGCGNWGGCGASNCGTCGPAPCDTTYR